MNRYNRLILFPLFTVLFFCFLTAGTSADDFGIKPRSAKINSPFFSVSAPVSPKTAIDNEEVGSSAAPGELPNVVRIISYDNAGQSLGSGSYIGSYDNYGLILSNQHIVSDADGLIHVHFPCGFSSFGYVLLSDEKWDLALLLISRPPSVSPLPLARHIPEIGESLWIAGFGSGDYRLAKGNCVRYMAPEIPKDGSAPRYEILDLSVSARQGDSGGPILNKNGELAGVLFGSDMVRSTAGSHCIRVSKFLTPVNEKLQKMPLRPEILFASVEPKGPKHSLYESKSTAYSKTPAAEPPRRTDDAAGSGFGVRSPSKRYIQPSSVNPSASYTTDPKPQSQYLPPSAVPAKTGQDSARPPQTNINAAEVHPAVWNQPLKFENDLSALNPSRSRNDSRSESESKLPELNSTYQRASYNEAYTTPKLAAMTELNEIQVRQIGQSVPLTPASFTNAVPLPVKVSFFGIAMLLVFTAIRILRCDAARCGAGSESGWKNIAAALPHEVRK